MQGSRYASLATSIPPHIRPTDSAHASSMHRMVRYRCELDARQYGYNHGCYFVCVLVPRLPPPPTLHSSSSHCEMIPLRTCPLSCPRLRSGPPSSPSRTAVGQPRCCPSPTQVARHARHAWTWSSETCVSSRHSAAATSKCVLLPMLCVFIAIDVYQLRPFFASIGIRMQLTAFARRRGTQYASSQCPSCCRGIR